MSDDFDIKSLPYDFKSASKPSETINRLLERKKYEHNKTMEWMRNKMAEINLVMDQKIKDSAQEVKKTLAKIKENVHEFIATVKAKTEIILLILLAICTILSAAEYPRYKGRPPPPRQRRVPTNQQFSKKWHQGGPLIQNLPQGIPQGFPQGVQGVPPGHGQFGIRGPPPRQRPVNHIPVLMVPNNVPQIKHHKVVEKSRKELRAHKTKYDEGCNRCCEEYEAECYKIANELGNMNSSVEIRGFVQTIKNRLLPMEKKINDLSEEYKDMCTSFLNDLKTSNYKFLKSISLHLIYVLESASKPSETINRLLERKKYEHNKTMEWMQNKMAEINLVMDQKIKDSAQEVKKTLAKIKENVHEFIATVKAKTEIKDFPDNYLFTSLKALKNFHADQHIAVDEFCKFMHDTEKIRMQQFKDVLKEAKTKCVAIAHEVPFVLDEIFELESVALNEATIKNYKDYAEIEQDLKLQIIYDFKNWTSEIMIIKDLLREHFRIMVKKSLPISVTGEVISRDMSRTTSFATPCELHRLDSLKSQFVYAFFGEDNVPVARDEVERWLKGVQRTLGSLDQTARNIVSLYKSVIPILFHRFLDELDEIKHSMCIAGICHKKEIEDFKCEIYTPTVEQLNIEYTHQLEELQNVWGHSIDEMTDTINETYAFLTAAACLWDQHFIRVKELQDVVLKDIEETIRKNGHLTDTYEASLNIEIEKLMEGSNEKDLSNALNNIYNILDKMELSYKTQSINEMEVVNKYKNMMNVGIEVLMAEVKRFLDVHPPDFEMDPKIQRRRASQITFYEIEEPILPIQILYCVFQVAAVKNWMFGLWEAIDQYFTTGRQEIEKRTEEWIEIQKQKIKERYDTKIAFHRPRYLHIKYSIYEKRLRGLQVHEKHLTCQKNVIFRRCVEEYIREHEFNERVEHKIQKVQQELKRLTRNLREKFKLTEKGLKEIYEEAKQNLGKIEYLESFGSKMETFLTEVFGIGELFSEGGNFSLQEVALTQSQLLKLEEGTRKHIEAIIATTEASREKYIARIQLSEANMIANVEEYIREHEFNERVEHKIQKVQQELKRLIRNLREKFKVTEKGLKEVYEEAKQNLGKIEYLESFGSKMETCLTEVFGIGEYITHPEPVQIFSVELGK
uniref:Uncharacterized protein LOC114339768 n=1 Tax=Diabrotica virgifera virgifera TaxID=50390 RepID=A0A6P7GM02_DIAVI